MQRSRNYRPAEKKRSRNEHVRRDTSCSRPQAITAAYELDREPPCRESESQKTSQYPALLAETRWHIPGSLQVPVSPSHDRNLDDYELAGQTCRTKSEAGHYSRRWRQCPVGQRKAEQHHSKAESRVRSRGARRQKHRRLKLANRLMNGIQEHDRHRKRGRTE